MEQRTLDARGVLSLKSIRTPVIVRSTRLFRKLNSIWDEDRQKTWITIVPMLILSLFSLISVHVCSAGGAFGNSQQILWIAAGEVRSLPHSFPITMILTKR